MAADIGRIINRLVHLKAELATLQGQVKDKEAEIEQVKLAFRTEIGAVGLQEGKTSTHSATVVEKLVPQVVSWDDYLAFIDQNKYFHLLQRRPSVPGCVELWEAGVTIPGCEQFKKIDVSVRKL